jgi:hypothetical protein
MRKARDHDQHDMKGGAYQGCDPEWVALLRAVRQALDVDLLRLGPYACYCDWRAAAYAVDVYVDHHTL